MSWGVPLSGRMAGMMLLCSLNGLDLSSSITKHTKGLKEGDEGGAEGGELLATHSFPLESLPDVLKVGMPHHAILLHRLYGRVGGEEVGQDSLGQETRFKNHDV